MILATLLVADLCKDVLARGLYTHRVLMIQRKGPTPRQANHLSPLMIGS